MLHWKKIRSYFHQCSRQRYSVELEGHYFFWLFLVFIYSACTENFPKKEVIIYAEENNDLYQLLTGGQVACKRFDLLQDALQACSANDVLLLLAEGYPERKTELPDDFYKILSEKKIKAYIEFPDRLPSGTTGPVLPTKKERLVLTHSSTAFSLVEGQILDAGLFSYTRVDDRDAWLKGANVAGFRNAIYGLDSTDHFPILFVDDGQLIATTKLSDFRHSRYSPINVVQGVINDILHYLEIELDEKTLQWSPLVVPMYNANQKLTDDAYRKAVLKGASWYIDSRFLIHPQWQSQWRAYDTLPLPVGPPVDTSFPSGDGSLGVMEGHYSYINPDGSQPYRYWLRADCVAETAMTLSMASSLDDHNVYDSIAYHLMDFLFSSPTFKTRANQNPRSNAYGLIGWADTHPYVYYGDDNARVLLGSILAARMLDESKWNEEIVELILANFRTTGKNGFRGNSLREPSIEDASLADLMSRDLINPAPHYESWLWAIYLWLYDKTGYAPLLEKARKAISLTMEKYPDEWIWTNGIQQERARLILPLAWLLRVEDIPQHRQWLQTVCGDLLQRQVACGALREELGVGNKGKYGAPASNAAYGHNEAPVIHENGDPVADMLYTSNFAFFALNEAAAASGDSSLMAAVDALADFLVRIQTNSSHRPDLNGCWFRAFDYNAWEYYGSNADHGWGAWGTL
ncbi:MAG: hypothetical protein KDC53_11730, partial [Saprospiraceae bacterium]|nr:hypothetical protein [Saprospiraceae bacterium]